MLALIESSIQLVPDGTLIFHLILVVVMVAILNLTLLKPINKVLDERERRTSGKLSEAQEVRLSAEGKLRAWEQGLRDARHEAYRLLEKQRAIALAEREERLNAAKTELAELVAVQKAEIVKQGDDAQQALEVEARRLAELIGSRILGRQVRA
jgi:F-type H+-transporting ATPase subunit b